MVEGGGLGKYHPTEIGPVTAAAGGRLRGRPLDGERQRKRDGISRLPTAWENGGVDLLAADDEEACALAKRYLSYFQNHGRLPAPADAPAMQPWQEAAAAAAAARSEEKRHSAVPSAPRLLFRFGCADQRELRATIPPVRTRVYDCIKIVDIVCDADSTLEIRAGFGHSVKTFLARIEGRAVAIICSNPKHLGGAIDGDSALKTARFLELADAHALPVTVLCDCPGFMVGPEEESRAAARKFARLFVVGASLGNIPLFATVVLRKAYGLGAQALCGGAHQHFNSICVSWPSGEFGGMGLEGAVKLGARKILADARASGGEEAEKELFDSFVASMYEQGSALNNASKLEIDDVIDPAETRAVLLSAMLAAEGGPRKRGRAYVSTW